MRSLYFVAEKSKMAPELMLIPSPTQFELLKTVTVMSSFLLFKLSRKLKLTPKSCILRSARQFECLTGNGPKFRQEGHRSRRPMSMSDKTLQNWRRCSPSRQELDCRWRHARQEPLVVQTLGLWCMSRCYCQLLVEVCKSSELTSIEQAISNIDNLTDLPACTQYQSDTRHALHILRGAMKR